MYFVENMVRSDHLVMSLNMIPPWIISGHSHFKKFQTKYRFHDFFEISIVNLPNDGSRDHVYIMTSEMVNLTTLLRKL